MDIQIYQSDRNNNIPVFEQPPKPPVKTPERNNPPIPKHAPPPPVRRQVPPPPVPRTKPK